MISDLHRRFDANATGTLGVNMHYDGALSIVTNNHVIAKNGNVGSWVYQPQPFLFQNSVAAVAGFIPVHSTPTRTSQIQR